MPNPFLTQNKIGDAGRSAEKRTGKRMGAQMTPASGAMAHAKGDARLPDFLIEMKSSTTGSVSLLYSWLRKISGEALMSTRKPVLTVTFTDDQGKPREDGKWIVIPESVFKELIER